MSAKKFKFVSPGVFLSEIDNSQLPKEPGGVGPVIIGRTRRGPALKPVKVSSFQEFVEIFGEPIPGSEGEDPWRDGNGLLATAYAPYAAQAYLKADINSPVTVVRLLGVQGDDASDEGHAGWEAGSAFGIFAAPGLDGSKGSPPSAAYSTSLTAKLVGIVYGAEDSLQVGVDGTMHSSSIATTNNFASYTSGANVRAVNVSGDAFVIAIKSGDRSIRKKVSLRDGGNYIRDKLNTSPVATNTAISTVNSGTLNEKYWLGETFEETYEEVRRRAVEISGGTMVVFTMGLKDLMADFKSENHQLSEARSGWVIPQHVGSSGSFAPKTAEKLFRFHAVQEGEQGNNIHVCIENIKIAETGDPDAFGRFDVVVKKKRADRIYVVDSFENLNLNPNSENFIARRIGDQHFEWDPVQKRNKVYGDYPNNSSYIRVQMAGEVGEAGPSNPRSVPFGYLGPLKPASQTLTVNSTSGSNPAGSWATGSVSSFGLTGMTIEWPTVPHVTTGSLGIDLAAKYVMGHTPYNRAAGTNDISYFSTNRGMKDYLRRLSSFTGHVSPQLTGIATSACTHGYVFSLDEVVVSGSKAPGSDLSNYNPTVVNFVSGSHVGRVAAKATITFSGQVADSATLIVTSKDADGTTRTISYTTAGGNASGENPPKFSRNAGQSAAGLKLAIDNAAGHENRITATVDGNTVTLTQVNAGEGGNISIGGTLNDDANATVVGFAGGAGPNTDIGTAYTARANTGGAIELLRVVDSFSMPLAGGFDGVDVTEADPFNMAPHTATRTTAGPDSTTRNSYAHASIDRAIQLIKDPETLEMNLAVMPGITNSSLTTKLIQTCEARADALAIIDLPDVYVPPSQKLCSSFRDRVNDTTPEKSAKNLIARQINSSYGATYYPWVKIRDTINGRDVWAPPSVVALGVMGYTEQRDEVWFAPAGFNRGGLNEGNAGVPVLQVSEQLLSSQRDRLYEANINPIASFVSEGLVVFGQKTLQMTPSALDRINVRRLLIFVKKQVSIFASQLLFDQNVPSTWNRFTGLVVPFLESVKTRLGLTDFKVVLDSTTTTPDLIDRNIMYAKIFLKPARAIEFIAVDFVITRTGASFDD